MTDFSPVLLKFTMFWRGYSGTKILVFAILQKLFSKFDLFNNMPRAGQFIGRFSDFVENTISFQDSDAKT